jgi:predicted phage tail component-like protein
MSKYLWFDGDTSEGIFLIRKINRPLFPEFVTYSTKIPYRAGTLTRQENDFEGREITCEFTILADTDISLRDKRELISEWLIKNEDKWFYFSDDEDRRYKGRVVETDYEQTLSDADGTLVFLCSDPYVYKFGNKTITGNNTDDGKFTVTNNGGANTYPQIMIQPTDPIDGLFKIRNETVGKEIILDRYIEGGSSFEVDCNLHAIRSLTTGENYMPDLDLSSRFFPLVPGDNIISIEPLSTVNEIEAHVDFKERWI